MRRQVLPALSMLAVMTFVLGVAYPLAVLGVGRVAFEEQAHGSIISRDGVPVGSRLMGQAFDRPEFFHPRPSSAGTGYNGTASAASNLGPTNPKLTNAVADRAVAYRQENGLGTDVAVPVDAVTASASGLDPHISVLNARLQAARVARVRNLSVATVMALVAAHTDGRLAGIFGEPGVNVLELNLALEAAR